MDQSWRVTELRWLASALCREQPGTTPSVAQSDYQVTTNVWAYMGGIVLTITCYLTTQPAIKLLMTVLCVSLTWSSLPSTPCLPPSHNHLPWPLTLRTMSCPSPTCLPYSPLPSLTITAISCLASFRSASLLTIIRFIANCFPFPLSTTWNTSEKPPAKTFRTGLTPERSATQGCLRL